MKLERKCGGMQNKNLRKHEAEHNSERKTNRRRITEILSVQFGAGSQRTALYL